ncbi:phage head closure protein [Weissella viridescens]|uniref:phage head closure protein n=1 Tax=Weissella viridescens TaxID=1629 RepID=UPI003AF2F111
MKNLSQSYNNPKRKYASYEFNRKAKFGEMKSVQNENTGAQVKTFVPLFSLYYAPVRRGLSLESQLEGTKFENTITIVIRHQAKVSDAMLVELDGVQYSIVNVESDDTNKYVAYDFVILKRIEKRK